MLKTLVHQDFKMHILPFIQFVTSADAHKVLWVFSMPNFPNLGG